MGKNIKLFIGLVVALAFIGSVADGGLGYAESSSDNYRIDESFIGPGGNLESESSQYKLEAGQSAAGNTGSGESSSDNFRTQSGSVTTSDPRLSCVINSSSLNLGALSTSVASTGTATFSVLNYTSYGYVVSIIGSPPSNSGHALTAMNPTTTSQVGTEQFGINLVANTSPTSFGADPAQVPDSSFSFGEAGSDYDAPNNYRYVAGETIAFGPKSSGQTDYTISYLVNVATTTPGGKYNGNQTIVCTGTY